MCIAHKTMTFVLLYVMAVESLTYTVPNVTSCPLILQRFLIEKNTIIHICGITIKYLKHFDLLVFNMMNI